MKTLLLNLPNPKRVIRRYMCSYHSHSFLYPPVELLSLAAIVTDWKKDEAILLDAVAEGLSTNDVIKKIESLSPELIVALTGFEIFEDDINAINQIKNSFPSNYLFCFWPLPYSINRRNVTNL